MSDGRRMSVALIVALFVHGVVAAFIGPPPPPKPKVVKKEDKIAKLKAIRQKVELPKPKPPEPPKPEPPKPEPPKPEVKPEPKPKPKPKKRKKRARRAKPKPKPAAPKPAAQPKVEPAPLVLENVNLTGAIAVQAGDNDVFGDPSVAANRRSISDDGEDDDDTLDGDDTGTGKASGKAPPKTVAPRPKRTVKGRFPDDAPSIGRTVEVKLSLYVGTDGRVKKVKVVRGAGPIFDRAAKKQAKRITFEPGTVGGRPRAMWVPWTFAFSPE